MRARRVYAVEVSKAGRAPDLGSLSLTKRQAERHARRIRRIYRRGVETLGTAPRTVRVVVFEELRDG